MEIPTESLEVRSSGSEVELHCRHGIYYQESSYGHLRFFAALAIIAGVICFLPWNTLANDGVKLKYYIAGGVLWGGICGLFPYFIRNAFGQHIIINPQERTLQIVKDATTKTIAWDQIVGLQICHQKFPEDHELDAYQLNLAWKISTGEMRRHCLAKNASKHSILRLGKKYEQLLGFKIFDQISKS